MYDVAIVGAGVTGSAIARELAKYKVSACVIERDEDVCTGTSKANSAIVHAGFDAKPGSLKAEMNVKGNAMMDQLSKDLDFPFKRNGSLVVCTKDQDPADLEKLAEQGMLMRRTLRAFPYARLYSNQLLADMKAQRLRLKAEARQRTLELRQEVNSREEALRQELRRIKAGRK